jgi:Ca2+-binding EF-hand superfamily protein
MRVRGMRLLDAFRAFDSNKDGKLSSSEVGARRA